MQERRNTSTADSPRWCDECKKYGDHHTDRHLCRTCWGSEKVLCVTGRKKQNYYRPCPDCAADQPVPSGGHR